MMTKITDMPIPPDGEVVPLTLEVLLAGITDENLHAEIETNAPVGNEMEF